ncbi:hypothetical protein ScPMuIL_013389 [Solemya velum]
MPGKEELSNMEKATQPAPHMNRQPQSDLSPVQVEYENQPPEYGNNQPPPTNYSYDQPPPTNYGYDQPSPTNYGYDQHPPTNYSYDQHPPTNYGYDQPPPYAGNITVIKPPTRVPIYMVPNSEPEPRDYVCFAVFATLCCFLPTGLVALIIAGLSRSRKAEGNYESARKLGRAALFFIILSIILGVVTIALYLIYMRIGHERVYESDDRSSEETWNSDGCDEMGTDYC